MILLFGMRAVLRLMAVVVFTCPYCGIAARQEVLERRNRVTVFFVPVLTVSTRYLDRCTNCGGETELTAQQARHSVEWAAGRPAPAA